MDTDFDKICRVCMKDGVMMSIFKVHISKKLMALASIQVWPDDGLPDKICNRCSAKLHISFQFKRQCEKTDAKLREIVRLHPELKQQEPKIQNHNIQHSDSQVSEKLEQDITQQLTNAMQQNCVYVECNSVLDPMVQTHDQNSYIPVSQTQNDALTPISYNIPQQNQLIGEYTIPNVGQVQVYNGTYTIPVQTMQPTNMMSNQGMPQMQMHADIQQSLMQQQQSLEAAPTTVLQIDQEKEIKSTNKVKKELSKDESKKQCPTCNKIFNTTTKLSRHMKTHATDQPYKCTLCTKQFSHSGNFKIHMRMHTDERPFKCMICNKGCRQAQDLEKHMRTHTGEKPHKCHICPRAFSTSSNLIAHIRTHTGERPYVCCVCQKAFCQSNELTKHMRTHTGEKSHICDICNKGFNGSSTLIVHRRSHTGERPYICIVCNKGFAQSSCLAVHMKRHTKENSFSCIKCEGTFTSTMELQEHLATHVNVNQFTCNVCDKKYDKATDLQKHLRTHSNCNGAGGG